MADTVQASHILIMYKGSQSSGASRTKDEALERIQMVAAEHVNGIDFADLAGEYSECPSAQDGGDLGEFGRGDMVPEFDEAVFELEVGDTSGVIETAFGYHLIHRTA
ncbi:MAG: peptidylprolyl isomerase [Rickettsiales bacterium]|jgi:parvulin-like peptidyl-prolyl isomerase